MGPISPFASPPHRKSRWVMAPGCTISGDCQIGGGLITSLRRCVMKLSAPSELSSSISSGTPSLLAFLHHCSVNSAFTLSATVFSLSYTDSLFNSYIGRWGNTTLWLVWLYYHLFRLPWLCKHTFINSVNYVLCFFYLWNLLLDFKQRPTCYFLFPQWMPTSWQSGIKWQTLTLWEAHRYLSCLPGPGASFIKPNICIYTNEECQKWF